jgi:hypothetical protein
LTSLFTVKDGLLIVNATPEPGSGVTSNYVEEETFVFADVNGDDWFYFEDTTHESSVEQSAKPQSEKEKASSSTFTARTISGSDTTLINFSYKSTPQHKVLHQGRCNFAGLTPLPPSSRKVDDGMFRVQA